MFDVIFGLLFGMIIMPLGLWYAKSKDYTPPVDEAPRTYQKKLWHHAPGESFPNKKTFKEYALYKTIKDDLLDRQLIKSRNNAAYYNKVIPDAKVDIHRKVCQ